MFRPVGDGAPLWESLLSAEVLRLPDELALVKALLDDPASFAPFAPYFHGDLASIHPGGVPPAADVPGSSLPPRL